MSNEVVGTLTMYSDVLRGGKSLAKYFASSYDAVIILEIIGRRLYCKIELMLSQLDVIFSIPALKIQILFFSRPVLIFLSVAAMESVVTF